MSATPAAASSSARDLTSTIVVSGVRNPRSIGVARYAASLAEALLGERILYQLGDRAPRRTPTHHHLANSSRALLLPGSTRSGPLVVTVHDVVPRTRALVPLYRGLAYPPIVRHETAVIVHTEFAADMLARAAGRRPRRVEVVPHPARRPRDTNRLAARRALRWPEDSLIAVVPGVIKGTKLVRETLEAASHAPDWRVALAGPLVDRGIARAARDHGALVLVEPDDTDFERAIVASDCVVCLRSGSVGETNGPLLDALGAGRAVLASATGSIPEVGGHAVWYVARDEPGIRAGLAALSDQSIRIELERAAAQRAAGLTWEASGRTHAALFREVFGA